MIEVTYQDQEVIILQDLVDLKDSVRVATDPMAVCFLASVERVLSAWRFQSLF